MKTTLATLMTILSLNAASALAAEVPIGVIHDSTDDFEMEIADDTFIPNIQGYACPWPAIDLPRRPYGVKLAHNQSLGFRVKVLGLAIKDPDFKYCSGLPMATDVFGKKFRKGAKVILKLHIVREIVEVNGETELRETISTTLFGVEIESVTAVGLGLD